MKILFKLFTFHFSLFTLATAQWWYPEMEIIPANPTANDEVVVRIFGDTPSNVLSASTYESDADDVFILNTAINLGPLAVIGFFETMTSLGQLPAGTYTAIADVDYGYADENGEFTVFDEQSVSMTFTVLPPEECMDLGEIDFGDCDMAMGIALINGECQYLSGYGWDVNGVDYSEYGFESFDECNYLCDCPEGWVYCFVDPCLVETCPAYPDAECVADYCGGCFADFYVEGELVECNMQFGCTDSQANNYNPDAVYNDGSCEYNCEEPNPAGCFQTGCAYGYECIDFGNSNEPGFCVSSGCFCDENYGWGCTDDCNGGTCIPIEPEPGDLCAINPSGFPGIVTCNYACVDIGYDDIVVGDGVCHDQIWGPWFNCPAFDCDGGDCGQELVNGECVDISLSCGTGDMNDDGDLNVLDVVNIVNFILSLEPPTDEEICIGDMNEDGEMNVLDIIIIVNIILNPQPQSIRIDTGTSYGECWGYCIYQLILEDGYARFTVYGWTDDLQFPDLVVEEMLLTVQWNQIMQLIDFEIFVSLDDVYGCPDCADGGAEWIEISMEDHIKRVTFEAYSEVYGIEELTLLLREYREGYWEQVQP